MKSWLSVNLHSAFELFYIIPWDAFVKSVKFDIEIKTKGLGSYFSPAILAWFKNPTE